MICGILNYNTGNLKSVQAALNHFSIKNMTIENKYDFKKIDFLIMPGVGSFERAMDYINKMEFRYEIEKFSKKNFILGICLGFQILYEKSEESPEVNGLGIIKGSVKKLLPSEKKYRIPHTGWNKINIVKNCKLFKNIPNNEMFYFVHSYYVENFDEKIITSTVNHGIEFCSSIEYNNILGMQFHPEKSGKFGLKIYENLLNL